VDEDEYVTFDGLGLAELVATKQVTAAELLEIAQRRADRINPSINAIVTRLDDRAERQLREPLTGPFAGVPFLLKDLNQDLAGIPTSAGCRALAHRNAEQTSTVVQRWLDAGLVVFGKTNTPEFGSKGVTEPELFGPTRNPWDLARTPGGSSGGAAAAVAAGILPVAAASDGGGSIRIPAGCTGLVGLKAGRGLIPFGPVQSEAPNGLSTHGVISRSVRDTAAMLDVLAGPDAVAAFAPALPTTSFLDSLDSPPRRLRIGYTTYSAIRESPHPEATRALESAAGLLTELGHDVEEVDPAHDDRQLAHDFLTVWFVHQAIEIARIKRETQVGDEGFEQDTRLMAALGRHVGGVRLQAAQERRHDHIAGLARLHASHDLLMMPSIGEPPIRVGSLELPGTLRRLAEGVLRARAVRILELTGISDQVIQRNLSWVPYTQLANMTGRPAISLPLYWTPEGLPLGVQFVAPLQSEKLLLRLARQIEVAAPWAHRRPAAETTFAGR
jgi:Asp-tRNA(Asn)/Glu-tRNA(Gln) amidotransferase A subunit family amidase